MVTVCREASFNAAHRLYNSRWSQEKNAEVFGMCSRENYHGHNYKLKVCVRGEVNPDTGYVYDMGVLGDLIDREIVQRFDHRNLNLDIAVFRDLIPTTENFVRVIYDLLRAHLDKAYGLRVILHETDKNSVVYEGV